MEVRSTGTRPPCVTKEGHLVQREGRVGDRWVLNSDQHAERREDLRKKLGGGNPITGRVHKIVGTKNEENILNTITLLDSKTSCSRYRIEK